MENLAIDPVYRYWSGLRSNGSIPLKSEFNALAIPAHAADIFLLKFNQGDEIGARSEIRLAGGNVCDMHLNQLRFTDFTRLFETNNSELIQDGLDRVANDHKIIQIKTIGISNYGSLDIAMFIFPLIDDRMNTTFGVGHLQIVTPPENSWWYAAYPLIYHLPISITVESEPSGLAGNSNMLTNHHPSN